MVDEREKYWEEFIKKIGELDKEIPDDLSSIADEIRGLKKKEEEVLKMLAEIKRRKIIANIKLMRTPEVRYIYHKHMMEAWKEIKEKLGI